MIRRTRNTAIKMALGCSALASIFLLNGTGAYAEDFNKIQASDVYQVQDQNQGKNEFLIDEPIKYYYDITKIQKHTGFKFKLPSTLITSKWKGGINEYQLLKLSDTSKAVVMNYDYNEEIPKKVDRHQGGMKLMIFKDDPHKTIEKVDELYNNSNLAVSSKYDYKENEKTYGNVKGKEIIVDRIMSHNDGGGAVIRTKYFIWQDDSVYYALNYDCASLYADNINDMQNLSIQRYNNFMDEDELNKIVNSFKDVDSISEIDYKNPYAEETDDIYIHPEISHIYDMDDLKEADELLKFKCKIPKDFSNNNIKLQKSLIECTKDPIKENRKYTLNLCYKNGSEEITFTQDMYNSYTYDKCEKYYSMKEKGQTVTDEYKNEGISTVESYDVNGIKIYKYVISFAADNNYIYYSWKDNDVYNTLEIKYTKGYEDDIAKEFITSKPVE